MLIEEAPRPQRDLPSAGTHTGILYQLIDLGTQVNDFNKAAPKQQRRVNLTWELPEELMGNGKPFVVSKEMAVSTFETAPWSKFIGATLGLAPQAVNTDALMGKACNLTIIHNETATGTYVKVDGFAPLKKSDKVPALVNKPVVYDISNPDRAIFDALPDFLKKKIMAAPEWTPM